MTRKTKVSLITRIRHSFGVFTYQESHEAGRAYAQAALDGDHHEASRLWGQGQSPLFTRSMEAFHDGVQSLLSDHKSRCN